MSGSILVKELDRMIDDPDPPEFYTYQQKAAWRRGTMRRAWRPADDPGHAATVRYKKRHMRQAWLAGYDAMNAAIRQATQS